MMNEKLSAIFRAAGSRGGKARAEKSSKQKLSQIGKSGAEARWAKHRKLQVKLSP